MTDRNTLEAVATELARAKRVLAITGAGISADSGLPTYRGIGGLYESDLTEDNMPIEVALSGEMMRERPEITWKYLHQIESSCRGARHNVAHEILAHMQDRFERFCVLTQNIDGFHRDAGSRDLIEIHGNVHALYCVRCGDEQTVPNYAGLSIPPACRHCGGLVRPRVVLFGEMLPDDAVDRLYSLMGEGVDLVLSIGTTSVFPYIAGPVIDAARRGLPTVEINPTQTEVTPVVRYKLTERAAVALPKLWQRLESLTRK